VVTSDGVESTPISHQITVQAASSSGGGGGGSQPSGGGGSPPSGGAPPTGGGSSGSGGGSPPKHNASPLAKCKKLKGKKKAKCIKKAHRSAKH